MRRTVSMLLIYLTCAHCANILGFFQHPVISHQMVFQSIWRELSLKGHQVTVVTPDPLNDPTLTNLTEISVRVAYDVLKKHKMQKILSKDTTMFKNIVGAFKLMDMIVETELKSTQFQTFIHNQEKHFDLILTQGFSPALYALSARFEAPIIAVSSLGMFSTTHDVVGNPNHPLLYPDHIFLNFHNDHRSLWEVVRSVVFDLWMKYYHSYVYVPRDHEMAKKYIGNGIPYVGDLERNISMLFLNTNPLIYPPRANVPAVLEMGQMHIKPVEPLPQDLQLFLDEAAEGAILFSLGSNVKSVDLDENLRKVVMQALAELPYRVLWKWESDHLPGKPPNVIIRKWFPQQDILAHPNLRAFVTQGGFQSIEEAISRKVPLVGMPFIGDQPTNVRKIVELGIGVAVDPATVAKDQLKRSIIEVAQNNSYRRRIREVRDLLYDKPMTGLEKVVWWCEYVIRNRGGRRLRSPTADISLFHYLLLDVVLMVVALASVGSYTSYKIVQIFIRNN